jgi:hypothetical protein
MKVYQPDILETLVEATEPARFSVLLRTPEQLREFVEWCQRSYVASDILRQKQDVFWRSGPISLDGGDPLALTLDSVEEILPELVAEYEMEKLRKLLAQ